MDDSQWPCIVADPGSILVGAVRVLRVWRKNDVGFDAIPDSTSLGVLACVVDGVNGGVYEFWVADDGLVVHYPHIHHSSIWVEQVEWVVGVVLKHLGPSFFACEFVTMLSCCPLCVSIPVPCLGVSVGRLNGLPTEVGLVPVLGG